MGIRVKYRVQLHQEIHAQDIAELPPDLQRDLSQYQQILSLDPYNTRRIASHNLKGALSNHKALEIDWNGIAYRLVYRIYEKPAPRRVVILSFAEHDPAYDRAIARRLK